MQILEGRFVYSATDLNNYLACEYLTALDLEVVRGARVRPEHDARQSHCFRSLVKNTSRTTLSRCATTATRSRSSTALVAWAGRTAAAATQAAMARGNEFIYQATFLHGEWVGHADFLRKVSRPLPGGRWEWHYEVEDTKLARHTEPYFF